MIVRVLFVALVALTMALSGAWSTADEKSDAFKPKCPISGKAANTEVAVDHHGGKVYLCCKGCVAPFTKDTAKYEAKANHQLVGTGQAKQKGCPLSGGKVNPSTALKVSDVSVSFCCNGCRGKVAAAKAEEQNEMVFGKKAFSKGFEVASK